MQELQASARFRISISYSGTHVLLVSLFEEISMLEAPTSTRASQKGQGNPVFWTDGRHEGRGGEES